jgi:hypothetical protein
VSLAVALSASTRDAAADVSGSRVRLQLENAGCTALRLDDVLPYAQVEVGSRLADASDPDAEPVAVKCTGDRITILVTGKDKAPRTYRTDLGSTSPSVRPRIVAIAIAEVLHDLDIVPRRPDSPPRVAPVIRRLPRPEPVTPTPLPPPRRTTELAAFFQATRFQLDGRWLLGGGLRFDYAQPWWSAGLDAAAATHAETNQIGRVSTLLVYMSPYVAGRWAQGPFTGRLGGGFAFGVGQITGLANSADFVQDKVTGPWGTLYGLLDFGIAVSDSVSFDLRGQMGWVTMSVVGNIDNGKDIERARALKGLWTSGQIGVALTL